MKHLKPFPQPVHVTQPLLPDPYEVYLKIRDIWDSRQLTNNGPMAQKLEELLSRYLKVGHLSLFNNGTVALQVACRTLRLTGEVITTPFTFAATPHALAWNGLTPVFCDIEDSSMNMDPERIEELITPRTSAILPVHVFGRPCDVEAIGDIAEKYGLKVLYDAAHAFGVEVEGSPIGTFGDISMFSLHATKICHTVEGGALTFGSWHLKKRANSLRNFGIQHEELVMEPGTNGKLNEVQAAIGLLVLDKVEEEIEKRRILTLLYREQLKGLSGLSYSQDMGGVKHNYPYFVIRIDEAEFGISRDELQRKLKEYNIFSRKYFYPLCSEFPCYRDFPSAAPLRLPVASKVACQVLSLPLYGSLPLESVEKICQIIRER